MSHARTITRPRINPGIALGVAGAVAFAPLLAGAPVHPATLSIPHISAPAITLSAVINPADIDALIANLNGALDSAGSTVAGIVGVTRSSSRIRGSTASTNDPRSTRS